MRDRMSLKHAQSMRKDMPEPEKRMWHLLRAERFGGIKFRRQKVIGKYIADFAANAPKLVIELDGASHALQTDYDSARTEFLEQQGYRVIRFSNLDVMSNIDGVLTRLAEAIDGLRSPPLPTLSPEGERANKGNSFSLAPEGERANEGDSFSLSPSGERAGERGKQR